MGNRGLTVSRAEFEANVARKIGDEAFLEDVRHLFPLSVDYDPLSAAVLIQEMLIARLSGEAWKG
jgi:hypothetical protein